MTNIHVPIRQGLDTALAQRRPAFTFVNITTPDDISDPNKQRTIRRHARAIATRRGRRPRTGPLSVTFDLVEGPGNSIPAPASSSESPSILPGPLLDPPPASPQDHDPRVLQSLEFLKPIGWGRGITPFSPFPIEVNQRMLQLVNFMHQEIVWIQRPLLQVWWAIGVSDKSAFNLSLANAALFFGRYNGQRDSSNKESLGYYLKSIRSMNQRLSDSVEGISNGVIGTVLGFACFEYGLGYLSKWKQHMDGLQTILKLRGGVGAIDSEHAMRLMLFWSDVNGAFTLDLPPRFPIPTHLALDLPNTRLSIRLQATIENWNERFPNAGDVPEILAVVAILTNHLNQVRLCSVARADMFLSRTFNPVLHRLLSLPRYPQRVFPSETVKPEAAMREAVRLALLCVFAMLRRRFFIGATVNDDYKNKLTSFLFHNQQLNWAPFLDLRLWVLVVAGIINDNNEIAFWNIAEIHSTMKKLQISGWDSVLTYVREFVWVDELMEKASSPLSEFVSSFH